MFELWTCSKLATRVADDMKLNEVVDKKFRVPLFTICCEEMGHISLCE